MVIVIEMNYIFGLIFIICSILIILIYTQKRLYTKKNNEMNILQVFDPHPDTLFNLYNRGLPIVLQKEIQGWDGFEMLLGLDYETIKDVVKENMEDILTIVKGNLQFHNNIFSFDWKIDITMIPFDINSPIYPVKQANMIQLFGTISGEVRVILFNPACEKYLGKFVNNVSSIDIKSEIEKDNTEMNFIEIILREGNMIYIPFGWFYFIYGNHLDLDTPDRNPFRETIILNCINKSLINF